MEMDNIHYDNCAMRTRAFNWSINNL